MAERGEVETRILDAAEQVFAREGVRRTRMGHVAEAAGCSRATLYRYFATKEALVSDYALRELEREGAGTGRAQRLPIGQLQCDGLRTAVREDELALKARSLDENGDR